MSSNNSNTPLIKSLLKGVTVSRLTLPDDANIYGNVHGGTILKFIEEAGTIIATRYCNTLSQHSSQERCVATMVRIEHMDFLQPMKIGQVAELTAEIVYTSAHSLLVEVKVQAEDIFTGSKNQTNQARLWYVPYCKAESVISVPQMTYDDPAKEEAGRKAYEMQKSDRQLFDQNGFVPFGYSPAAKDQEIQTVSHSQTFLSFLVGPNDVTLLGNCRGGVILKLMDECGGIVAAKHCHTNVVTACLNATNFYHMMKMGSLVSVYGRVTFTSSRSLEVEVVVEAELLFGSEKHETHKAVDAFFTYVSIDQLGKALPIPGLKIQTPEEEVRYKEGLVRYELRKVQRNKK